MKHIALKYLAWPWMLVLTLLSALPAGAELPQRNLVIELRQVEEAGTGFSVGTQSRDPLLAVQQVQVRNGEKASLQLGQSMPMQWVQSVSTQNATLSAGGASASNSGGAVAHALTWMEAGQSFKVQPRWPGATQPVTLDIEVKSAHVGDRVGADLPDQFRSQMVTSVRAPIGQWVTIAATGSSPQAGVYGSDASSNARRLLQIRVLAPTR